MSKQKRSFFERLTGTVKADETDFNFPEPAAQDHGGLLEEDAVDGELPVDVYNTPADIIVKTMIAGINPHNNLDIDITRNMISIRGTREAVRDIEERDYYHKELYWGTFVRTVSLPEEVEVDEAEATEKNGLLTIRLPKINKAKQNKLKVKSS